MCFQLSKCLTLVRSDQNARQDSPTGQSAHQPRDPRLPTVNLITLWLDIHWCVFFFCFFLIRSHVFLLFNFIIISVLSACMILLPWFMSRMLESLCSTANQEMYFAWANDGNYTVSVFFFFFSLFKS